MPRVPHNVTTDKGADQVREKNAALNREQAKQSRKIAKAAESAASKVRSHG